MADLTTVLDAVAEVVRTAIPGVRVFSYAPDSINPPTVVVDIERIEFDENFRRGADLLTLRVTVLVSRADDRSGLTRLKEFMGGSGASSLKAAIEVDDTLGGVAETLRVTGVDSIGARQIGDVAYFGADFNVQVWAEGVA